MTRRASTANTSTAKRAQRHRGPDTYNLHDATTAAFWKDRNHRRRRRRSNRWLRDLRERYE